MINQNNFDFKSFEKNIRPRDIVTKDSFINAAVVVAATGGSTNGALHLPAMANEIGIDFDLFDVAEIFKSTPYIADLKPGGNYVAKDMYEAGGVPMLLRTLLDEGFIKGDCLTVTGKSLEENIADVKFDSSQKVIYPANNPITKTGGVVGLKGTFAPDGAIVKVAGMENLKFSGPARCFDCEEDAFAAVDAKEYNDGEVIIIRYEGPKGGPGEPGSAAGLRLPLLPLAPLSLPRVGLSQACALRASPGASSHRRGQPLRTPPGDRARDSAADVLRGRVHSDQHLLLRGHVLCVHTAEHHGSLWARPSCSWSHVSQA